MPPSAPGLTDPQQWDDIVNLVSLPVYVVDVQTYDLVALNQASGQASGTPQARQPCHLTLYGLPSPCPACPLAKMAATDAGTDTEVRLREFQNPRDRKWYQLHECLMTWFDGRAVMHSVAVDISQLKEVQSRLDQACAEINKISIIDPLTGVANRAKLDQVLDYEVQRANRYDDNLSFILTAIDRFDDVADIFGQQSSDLVLADFAKILIAQTRKIDTVGRWAGSDFLAVCPDTSLVGARSLAEKLRRVVSEHTFDSIGARTASFGVVQFRKGETRDTVIARLIEALTQAQSGGRNRVVAAEKE